MDHWLANIWFMLGFICAGACVAFGIQLWAFGIGWCIGCVIIGGIEYLLARHE